MSIGNKKIIAPVLLSMSMCANSTEIKFLEWNIWHGSQDKHVIHDIQAIKPDVMVLLETYSRQDKIKSAFAKANNITVDKVYTYTISCLANNNPKYTGEQNDCFPGKFELGIGNGSADNLSVWSVYPIIDYNVFDASNNVINNDNINRFNYGAVKINVDNKPLWVAGFWLSSSNGSLEKLSRLYVDKRDAEIKNFQSLIDQDAEIKDILKMDEHRAKQARQVIEKSRKLLDNADNEPVILAGDANTFSHLDWSPAWKEGHYGITIPFPVSKVFTDAGLIDSYRQQHPNPLLYPCSSWKPQAADAPKSRTWSDREPEMIAPGRIDYIYYKGSKLNVKESVCIGNVGGGVTGGTSDHAAILTTFTLN